MATLEELTAEAAELYPESQWIQYGDRRLDPHEVRFIAAGKRTAYIRAKTISAEQLEAAAKGLLYYSYGKNDLAESAWAETKEEWIDEARDALEAAGFYVEGD